MMYQGWGCRHRLSYCARAVWVCWGFLLCITCVAAEAVGATDENGLTQSHSDRVNLRFRHIDDLAVSALGGMKAITQDRFGFIWLGGTNGLARWDGYSFRLYKHNDSDHHSMSTNNVNDFVAEDDGGLWIATYWGLNHYDASTEHFERYLLDPEKPRSLSHNGVLQLKKTKAGDLWIATDGGGLLRYAPATNDFDRFPYDAHNADSISGNSLSDLEEDSEGLLWVGIKDGGIDIFDPVTEKVVRRLRHDPSDITSLSQHHPTSIRRDSTGTLWVGTYYGLNQYLGDGEFKRYFADYNDPKSLPASNINQVMADSSGGVWVGAGDQGVSLFKPKTSGFERYLAGAQGEGLSVTALFSDIGGALWLGFSPGGIARVDRYAAAFVNYQSQPGNPNSLTHSNVLSVVEDGHRNLWVGTRNGLNYIDRQRDKITRYRPDDTNTTSLPSPSVNALVLGDDGDLWAGTGWDGIGRLDVKTQTFRQYRTDEANKYSLFNREVWSFLKGSDGAIWVGTNMGGVHRYRPETDDFFRYHFRATDNATSGRALSLHEDDRGAIWLSTDNGLFRLKDEFKNISIDIEETRSYFDSFSQVGNHSIFLSVPIVRHTFTDSRNNMWFATAGGGLNKWDRVADTFHVYQVEDGLIHNSATAIEEDNAGYIWVSTEGGISRFNPATNTFKNFTKEHGLPGDIYSYATALKTADGEIVFGGINGLTIINPNEIFTNSYQSPLVMTAFYLFNQPVKIAVLDEDRETRSITDNAHTEFSLPQSITVTEKIILRHEQSVITFEFALLNYDVTKNNLYRYRLEGFDEEWTEPDSRRKATYTNLDPGNYRFRVKATNNEGIPMDQTLDIELLILPPWWATWWAYSLYGIAFVSVTLRILYSQYAKRQFVENQNKLLEVKIAERTKQLMEKNEELQSAYKKMEDASYSDPLTGLRNRRYLYHTMPRDLARVVRMFERRSADEMSTTEGNIAFYLLDIDNFKSVNDQHGHANGDLVLKTLANVLVESCRESDIVFRWGGEEFLIVCPYVTLQILDDIAERLRSSVENIHFELDNKQIIHRTASIGYACFPFDPRRPSAFTMEQTIDLADWCLYRVKKSGRNGWAGLQLKQAITGDINNVVASIDEHIRSGVVTLKRNRSH